MNLHRGTKYIIQSLSFIDIHCNLHGVEVGIGEGVGQCENINVQSLIITLHEEKFIIHKYEEIKSVYRCQQRQTHRTPDTH